MCIGYDLLKSIDSLFPSPHKTTIAPQCISHPQLQPAGNPSSAPIHFPLQSLEPPLRDEGAGGGALVAPVGGQVADLAVVPREAVDPGLDENEAELGVLVLAVALEVLADGDGLGGLVRATAREDRRGRKRCAHLLDQVVEVLGELGGEACTEISMSAVTNRGIMDSEPSIAEAKSILYVVWGDVSSLVGVSSFMSG